MKNTFVTALILGLFLFSCSNDLGNASRCVNIELMEGGVGKFLWSEITGGEDADITYTVENNEFEYCFVDSFCSGSFVLVDDNLESAVELTLDDDCSAVFVLRRK